MASYWANWARDHRLVTVRTSTASPRTARLEHRMADAAANPYLAVAAVLQAAKLGIDAEEDYRLPAEEDFDGLENVRATRHVPSSLLRALGGARRRQTTAAALLCDALIALKRNETQRLSGKSVDGVREFYLPFI